MCGYVQRAYYIEHHAYVVSESADAYTASNKALCMLKGLDPKSHTHTHAHAHTHTQTHTHTHTHTHTRY